MEVLSQASIMALLSMAVSLAPLIMGIAYAVRPSEGRLALMRPLSLAGIFSALTGCCLGLINVLVGLASSAAPVNQFWQAGLAESLVSLFIGFGSLTVAWLCVALGLRRQASD